MAPTPTADEETLLPALLITVVALAFITATMIGVVMANGPFPFQAISTVA